MSPKWTILILMVWLVLALLGGIIEGAYMGTNESSALNTLLNTPLVTSNNPVWGFIQTIFDFDTWSALAHMAFFDFAMFEGTMAIFQWIFFFPLSIAFMLSLLLAIRGTSSG